VTKAEEKAAAAQAEEEASHRAEGIKHIAMAINRLGWDTRMQESDQDLATKLFDAALANESEAAAKAEAEAAAQADGSEGGDPA
jgi:hypothetical protein